ncbi:response regulator [Salmonella enterica]|uniref:PFGI-1 class ICE element type IV pilus protein PilL2 n=1 Tax=Salmonella enterica TaxID=28901 RepID=UPI000A198BB0|nr:response regulator [Salmonella enterica]EAW1164401.1 response regulator [Salmonella enterica subsp. enterica]EAW1317388.1 response regulator [Salmonella enterica subsp. diarizonae]ECS6417445.1 response regulator [Salmonella enterica subsp. diarizonae serovar 50:r:z]EAN1155992.1 response regulator [Salmonella enterica]EAO0948094.1 response regulator [Salmonella enterica]
MARTTGMVITLLMLGGCTVPQQPIAPAPKPATPPTPEVVRYDRYLLINTRPDEAQRNPLHQVVNINLPLNLKLTVGDAFTWLLKQSGYSLCVDDHPTQFLAGKPLPLSQYRLGPMRLEEALKTLAGPSWLMQTDVLNREVCFHLNTPGTGDHHA